MYYYVLYCEPPFIETHHFKPLPTTYTCQFPYGLYYTVCYQAFGLLPKPFFFFFKKTPAIFAQGQPKKLESELRSVLEWVRLAHQGLWGKF